MEILTGKLSKAVDKYCIDILKIPSLVLMERAALGVRDVLSDVIRSENLEKKVKIICGVGNNGADGLAVARILSEEMTKTNVSVRIVGNEEKASEEFRIQYRILLNIGADVAYINEISDFKQWINGEGVIVDAIFGIGLSRNISGMYEKIIEIINEDDKKVISVDCPSGLDADNGIVMGNAVKAYKTVTFGKLKSGLVLCDGKNYSGTVIVKEVGFNEAAYTYVRNKYPDGIFTALTKKDLDIIPKRSPVSNKGTYGRVKVIAGSKDMCGAAILSATAVYRSGAGIVEVLTHKNNLQIVKGRLIEAIVRDYTEEFIADSTSIIVIGPGLSTDEQAEKLVKKVLLSGCYAVIDADGLNVISSMKQLKLLHKKVIITPHIKEMSRLIQRSSDEIRENIINVAREFSKEYGCVTVIKDATTVIADSLGNVTINLSGNSGMSTGGSGDVLAGIIGGLLSQKMSIYEAACMGVYLHGLAGDIAMKRKSSYGMMASDILDAVTEILKLRN